MTAPSTITKSAKPTAQDAGANEVQGIKPLLTKAATARILGVCIRTVENLLVRKLLRPAKVGNRVRIDPVDLQAYINAAKVN